MSSAPLTRQKLCLAMIVRDEASIIQRCLLSIKPFINTWLIHDMGSSDDTKNIVESTLGDLNGQLVSRKLDNFANARNSLLKEASKLADVIIMLDADEEFQSLSNHLTLPEHLDTGLIDITQNDYTLRVPRLFRSTALPIYYFDIDEKAIFEQQAVAPLPSITIQHHQDGLRNRQASTRVTSSPNNDYSSINPLLLALHYGQQALKATNYQAALTHFQTALDSPDSSNEFWQACYLAANTQLALGETEAAIELLRQCFESNPERAEPLMRIAELQHQHGEHQAAYDLCKLIVDMPIADNADYFEQKIYSHTAQELLNKTAPSANDDSSSENNEPPVNKHSSPQSSVSDEKFRLTIGMATYDDYDGVYFSIMSLVLYHREFLNQFEILVIDNNPNSDHGTAVKNLCNRVSQARYVAAGEYKGTAVRERIFAEAKGELVVCMDCHVFLHQGAVERLLDYAAENPDSKDLIHGPLFYDNHENFSTHMEPVWHEGFYGKWGVDNRAKDINAEPFEIPLQGMGLFACFKRHWLGFNHRFRGFGGEEGYIHEKFRQNGGRILCLPFLRWTHRFDRPNGTQYVNAWGDRVRNYLIGWHELGLNSEPVLEHFAELQNVGLGLAASINSKFLRELNSPLWNYDTIYLLSNSEEQKCQSKADLCIIAIDNLVQEVSDISEIPSLLRTAVARKLKNVLMIDVRGGVPENLHLHLQNLVTTDQADVAIQTLTDENSYQACLIQQNAFEDAANCYIEHQHLSKKLLTRYNSTLKVNVTN